MARLKVFPTSVGRVKRDVNKHRGRVEKSLCSVQVQDVAPAREHFRVDMCLTREEAQEG